MHRIKRYDQFCEIFHQICYSTFDARFALVLCYKVLLFETRKHSQSLQAISLVCCKVLLYRTRTYSQSLQAISA